MQTIKNILVASELNKDSYEALAYAITLGLIYDAKVSCIHVVKPSPIDIIKETLHLGSAKYGEALKNAKVESENLLSHIVDVIVGELGVGEVDVDLKIVSGSLSKSIMTHAEEIKADLVLIGTDAGTKFGRTPHTNLALNMIELGITNVLLIPSGFKMERIEQIGGFINFEVEEIEYINKLMTLAKKTDNALKLIHIVKEQESIDKAKNLQRSFERLFSTEISEKKLKFELEIGSVTSIIANLKANHNVDLTIIRAYKRHWGTYSSANSFADKVIKNMKTPLLVWKKDDESNRIVIKHSK